MSPSSERLRYRLVDESDSDWLVGLWTSVSIMQFIGEGSMSEVEARNKVSEVLSQKSEGGFGYWVVREKTTENRIGYVVLRDFQWDHRIDGIELGYIIEQEFWGKRYASEAAQAVKDYAVRDLGVSNLYALVDRANLPSRRIMEKLEFSPLEIQLKRLRDSSIWEFRLQSLKWLAS